MTREKDSRIGGSQSLQHLIHPWTKKVRMAGDMNKIGRDGHRQQCRKVVIQNEWTCGLWCTLNLAKKYVRLTVITKNSPSVSSTQRWPFVGYLTRDPCAISWVKIPPRKIASVTVCACDSNTRKGKEKTHGNHRKIYTVYVLAKEGTLLKDWIKSQIHEGFSPMSGILPLHIRWLRSTTL